jgi:carboxynorspermidine decarboxylase
VTGGVAAFPGEACKALDLRRVPSPSFVVDLGRLERNVRILADVQARAECKVLLALKGFAMWATAPLVRRHLSGTTASGLYEAKLGAEHFGGESHVYSAAFTEPEMRELVEIVDHVSFNSFSQWEHLRPIVDAARAAGRAVSPGIRVNPEHSEVQTPLYDPCAPGSRLGVTRAQFRADLLDGIEGLHFHTLCELGADALARTIPAFEAKFGEFIPRMKWINMGGGHHVTHADYDVERLVSLVRDFRARHGGVPVYLEPGEAIAIGTGVLVVSVLDVIRNGDVDIAILDTSATCHMPDVLEMPYRPVIRGAGDPGEKHHTYRLGGMTCLAGDVIGDWSFDAPLRPGDRLVFEDMAHYTMVKTTMFNGVRHPSLCTFDPASDDLRVVRAFRYADYRDRLS